MPTPEEIKKLCTEYVDELFAFDDMSEQENIEAKNDAFVMCMAFAGHILEKHCIVPKSKVKENYQSLKNDIPDFKQDPKRHCGFLGGMTELELLFGPELFNEEKG